MAEITGARARNMLTGLAKDNSAYLRRLERDKYQEIAHAYEAALNEISSDLAQQFWDDPDELSAARQYQLAQQLEDRMLTLSANYESIYLDALQKGIFYADEVAQEEWAILQLSLEPMMREYFEPEDMQFNAVDFPAVEKGLQRALKEYRLINNAAGRVIETDLRVGMLRGEGEKQLMKRLGQSLDITKNQQRLAARRGVHTANNLARDHYIGQWSDSIPNLGKQAIASVGANTTKTCLKVHGQIVAPGEEFTLEGTPRFSRYMRNPPFHWNCRTSVVAYHPSWDRTGAATTEDMQKAAQAELDRRLHKATIAKMFPQDAITPTKWAEIFGDEAKKLDVEVEDTRPAWLRGKGTAPSGDRHFSKTDHYRLNRRFCRGIGANDARLCSWEDRGKVKDELVRAIAKESGLDYEAVNEMIRQWAHSSNDDDMRSLYIQERASELFGAPLSPWQKGLLKKRYNAQARYPNNPANFPLASKEETDAFLQGMYKITQQDLAELGYGPNDKIILFRGMRMRADTIEGWAPGDVIDVRGNTVESWAYEPGVAHQFAASNITGSGGSNAGVVVAVEIPVSRIVGTARTGVGCITETEIVALGTGGAEGGGNTGRIVTIFDKAGRKHTTGQTGKKTEW